ncbi:alpha/beta hydrolase [Bacillus sp. FJAT-45350]|uniref:alpha/beta hydrolase n=1 Tax=Bacillus sp. FJAT-45350 TaxID=2011014 RepID=UPI00115524B9|nr:alpha/beta hydrolase [Bacillus sp. FJAT-45350]
MSVKKRYFCIDGEWGIVHLPEKPNGFAVFILGDINHFVNKKTSFWVQHPDRKKYIEKLRDKGYTVFLSNLYGRNWGSKKAVQLAEHVYHVVMKKEILNSKIHLVAEGMGALVAINLIKKLDNIRSVVFINPCLHLYHYYDKEKRNKLFFKRFCHELSLAHQIDEEFIEELLLKQKNTWASTKHMPIHIIHETSHKRYSMDEHSKQFEHHRKKIGDPITLTIYLPGKPFSKYAKPTYTFFQKYEKEL